VGSLVLNLEEVGNFLNLLESSGHIRVSSDLLHLQFAHWPSLAEVRLSGLPQIDVFIKGVIKTLLKRMEVVRMKGESLLVERSELRVHLWRYVL
jgi:hypothetical protein